MKHTVLFVACILLLPLAGCKNNKNKGSAKIDAHCTMNGYGSGTCSFTNKGTAAGAHCVKVRVYQEKNPSKSLASSSICSGNVGVKETKSKSFTIPGVNSLCSSYGVSWTKVCGFVVLEDK